MNNTFILTARLPQSFQRFQATTYEVVCKVVFLWTLLTVVGKRCMRQWLQVHWNCCTAKQCSPHICPPPVQLSGPSTAPVTAEAQSALAVAVSTAPGWNYGQMTQVDEPLNMKTRCCNDDDVFTEVCWDCCTRTGRR